MPLILKCSNESYKKAITERFQDLVRLFDFDPNTIEPKKIEVTIVPTTEEFLSIYSSEFNESAEDYVVGFAASNGRIFVLDKSIFPSRGHKEEEFERVILHELCHIFVRRMLDPKSTYVWIEEGICEYLSFGDYPLKIKELVDFKDIKDADSWGRHPAYQQARAFFRFLSEEYGKDKIASFLFKVKEKGEEEAFKDVYGDLKEVQDKFFASLKNATLTPSQDTL